MKAERRPEGRRPEDSTAAKLPFPEIEFTADQRQETIPAQLRRRRAASKRLEVMPDGRHDVLELAETRDPWSSSRRLHVEIVTKFTANVYGGRLKRLLDGAGIACQWNHRIRTWQIARVRVADLITYAEHFEGRFCTIEELAAG